MSNIFDYILFDAMRAFQKGRNKRGERRFSVPLMSGGGKGIRTPDPLAASQVLSQLSHTPTNI